MKTNFWSDIEGLISHSSIVIDREKNSGHPKYPDWIYPVDYGHILDTSSSDGHEIDIWVGTSENRGVCAALCTFDPIKKDSEIKILYNCTDKEIQDIYEFQNIGMSSIIITNN